MVSLALAFIIEAIALVSYGYLGTMLFSTRVLKIIGAVLCIGFMAYIWGSFFSPKADHRLVMPGIFVGKLLFLLMPSYILLYIKNFTWAAIWAIVVMVHLVISAMQKQI
jgi:hypothetical protein